MADTSLTPERLLAEIEDVLRTMPPRATIHEETEENHRWLGRAVSVIEHWQPRQRPFFNLHLSSFLSGAAFGQPAYGQAAAGFQEMMVLLHQAHNDLRMRTLGPINVAVGQGRVFDYFEEIRKTIELATEEVLFVDAYLDADFVSRYLPFVRTGVSIRLLTSAKKLNTLLPAIDLFMQQYGHAVSVRSANDLHDRFVFIDKASCYQSGASFKDGARKAGTIITQITDAFKAMWDTYERLWDAGNVER